MNDQCETCPIFDECPAGEQIADLETERDKWKSRAESAEEYCRIVTGNADNAYAERDRWKARAEAMERAMRGDCSYCANRYEKRFTCESCCLEGALQNWELDQTKFTPIAPEAEAAE